MYVAFIGRKENKADVKNQGGKFKDWELIGLPYQIIVGKRASEGIVELKDRRTLEKKEVNYLEAISFIVEKVRNI